MRKYTKAFLSLAVWFMAVATWAGDALPVFIVAGQSNAFRLGGVSAKPSGKTQGPVGYYVANPACTGAAKLGVKVRPMRLPVGGMGAGIFRTLAKQYPQGFGLIRYGICGSNLHTQWRPGEPDGYFSAYFKPFVEKSLAAIAAKCGKTPEVMAVLWHQGESQAKDDEALEAYPQRLPELITQMQVTFGPVPMVMGEIRDLPDKPRSAEVNRIMKTVTADYPHVSVVGLQDVKWLPKGNVHLSQPGAVQAGTRMVNRAVEMLAEESAQ